MKLVSLSFKADRRPLKFKLCMVLTAALLGFVGDSAWADIIIPAFRISAYDAYTSGGSLTRGIVFNVTSPVNVVGLSFYDEDADGLTESHPVGLWDSSGTLLASLSIDSGTTDPLDSGQFRYKLLNQVLNLPTGIGYRVGSLYLSTDQDKYGANVLNIVSEPGINYVSTAYAVGDSLAFPLFDASNNGFFGGSFVLQGADVPEPETLTLIAIGGLAWFSTRRRQTR